VSICTTWHATQAPQQPPAASLWQRLAPPVPRIARHVSSKIRLRNLYQQCNDELTLDGSRQPAHSSTAPPPSC
jgi:hypothetical protein